MFLLKNMNIWTNRKLKIVNTLINLIYLGLSLLAPLVIICVKYDLLEHKDEATALNGLGIIIALTFAVLGLKSLKKVIDKLNDVTYKEQKFKYTLQMGYAIAIPLLCVVVLVCFKENFELAYDTFCWCLGFFVGGIGVDYMFLKYLDKERYFRKVAAERIQIDARIDVIKKENKK